MADVSVLYIARGIDAGLDALNAFLEAWHENPPLSSHQLYFLAKGWHAGEQRDHLASLAQKCSAKLLEVSEDGFDWGAYFEALPSLQSEWLCLMNSFSRPQTPGWLSMLKEAAASEGRGLAGATGSWESLRWRFSARDPIRTSVWQLLRAVKNHGQWRHFDLFPNPHLRSTGLVLRRSMLESFAAQHGAPRNKFEAHRLESGRDGLSNFAKKQGCPLTVVGRNGQQYAPTDWPSSGTFRSRDQENLLISDNRTRDYDIVGAQYRASLKKLAWGSPSA